MSNYTLEENRKTKREWKREHDRMTEKVLEWLRILQDNRLEGKYNPMTRDLENWIQAGVKKLNDIAQNM